MNRYLDKQNLMIELTETEHLLNLTGDHPLMSIGLRQKVEYLRNALLELDEDFVSPTISLLFSGKAVNGSMGIKTSFLAKILNPIQDMIKVQTAELKFNHIGKRGVVKGNKDSELYLTALPVGSFGIELSHISSNNLFSDIEVSHGIDQVVDILIKTAKSDDAFSEIVSELPNRTLSNLKKFLKEVSNQNSIIKMRLKGGEIIIDKDSVKLGYDRVKSVDETEELITINGVLRGLMLDANKFEFFGDDGARYQGKISESLDSETLIEFAKDFLNDICSIRVVKKTIVLNGSITKSVFILESINQ